VNFIPAIDLKDNKCVRLLKGMENELTVFNKNPLEQAKFFEKEGCKRIHIVDLDGAFGRANINKKTILDIRKNTNLIIELGGGIKNIHDINFWLNNGIDFLVLGSLAIKNQNLIIEISANFKNKIYIALDALDDKVMIRGWVEDSTFTINEILKAFEDSFIKGFIYTDISRDGMLEGLNIDLIKKIILKTNKSIIVGGGLSDYLDLYKLKKIKEPNLEGVIAGKSFYSGNIKINKALEIFRDNA